MNAFWLHRSGVASLLLNLGRREERGDGVEPIVETIEAPFKASDSLVDALEVPVDALEVLVDAVEAFVNAVEAFVDTVEPLVDTVEALVDRNEALVDRNEPGLDFPDRNRNIDGPDEEEAEACHGDQCGPAKYLLHEVQPRVDAVQLGSNLTKVLARCWRFGLIWGYVTKQPTQAGHFVFRQLGLRIRRHAISLAHAQSWPHTDSSATTMGCMLHP